MKKLKRKLDTPESREYWAGVDDAVEEVKKWPKWKREYKLTKHSTLIETPPELCFRFSCELGSIEPHWVKSFNFRHFARSVTFPTPKVNAHCEFIARVRYTQDNLDKIMNWESSPITLRLLRPNGDAHMEFQILNSGIDDWTFFPGFDYASDEFLYIELRGTGNMHPLGEK